MPRRTTTTPYHDAAWIIALWRALHGGDPSPEDVAADVIAGLSGLLPGGEGSFQSFDLHLSCAPVDPSEQIEDFHSAAGAMLEPAEGEFSIHHYCFKYYYFKFKGQCYRLDLPALTRSPTAA